MGAETEACLLSQGVGGMGGAAAEVRPREPAAALTACWDLLSKGGTWELQREPPHWWSGQWQGGERGGQRNRTQGTFHVRKIPEEDTARTSDGWDAGGQCIWWTANQKLPEDSPLPRVSGKGRTFGRGKQGQGFLFLCLMEESGLMGA